MSGHVCEVVLHEDLNGVDIGLWQATCTCGWHGKKWVARWTADRQAERHEREHRDG